MLSKCFFNCLDLEINTKKRNHIFRTAKSCIYCCNWAAKSRHTFSQRLQWRDGFDREWHRLFPTRFLCFTNNFPACLLCSRCYRCHCPPQFDGPDCQQTRLRFLGNGYAWLPPIRPCFDSHLSLEFLTEEEDGLLLYAGPLATLLPGDAEDFIAVGKWLEFGSLDASHEAAVPAET